FMMYSESTNTWSYGPYPPVGCQSGTPTNPCFAHGYDHSTVDPATGDFYYRHYNSTKVYRYRGGSWAAIAPIALSSIQCCGALEYFPDMGRLIFVDGDWGVMAYNPSTDSWSRVANGNVNVVSTLAVLTMSSYNNFAVYNPVAKVVLFGGGKSLYRL